MAIIDTWCPPSHAHWERVVFLWQFFPIVVQESRHKTLRRFANDVQFTLYQWLFSYYPMGKTSKESRFNIPGKIGWATMEAPGFITLLYIMYSLPKEQGIEQLPWANWVMASLFVG